jgi:hypothetical protein
MPGQFIGDVVNGIPPLSYAPFGPCTLGPAYSDQEGTVLVTPAAEKRCKVRPRRRVIVDIAPCNRLGCRWPAALLSHHVEPFLICKNPARRFGLVGSANGR